MRLLLDEHLSKAIAEQLRARGIDAVAVTEDLALRGRSDRDLLKHATQERRAFVTNDVKDLRPAINERIAVDEPHYGVIFVSTKRFPRGKSSVGAIVAGLEQLSASSPEDGALRGREVWL